LASKIAWITLRVPALAALEDLGLHLRAPALADVLAGEVDDRVAARQRLPRRGVVLDVPGERLDAEQLGRPVGIT
jgi:hypothetical protein